VRIVLLSTYDLGHQPFGVASPAAWLRQRGHTVRCVDLSLEKLPEPTIREAEFVAFYLPMHTATQMAAQAIQRVRGLNPATRLCCYGLYAPMNEQHLRNLGVQIVVGGEFEAVLAAIADEVPLPDTIVSLDRLRFIQPDRGDLPALSRYPKLLKNHVKARVGYTEASRGCKHQCRHCPVVPVYAGSFRIVQRETVLADIRQQVEAGAEHITFGDPDFFNGPAHATRIVEALHTEFPGVTYDCTIKIEHLLQHAAYLPILKETGCLFVTSAVESVDDRVLEKLDKGHTRADFITVVEKFRHVGLTLAPTFIPFTPWTTRAGYDELLKVILDLDLVDSVAAVQLMIRLLIPSGSRLLELEDIRRVTGSFDPVSLAHPWKHPEASVDKLAMDVAAIVRADTRAGASRRATFRRIWEHTHERPLAENFDLLPRTVIPYMEEPWFC
jgi:radical SAM superfamily enzyme YgiQ (UPF0313 family)